VDEIVLRSIAKWPNLPAVYGWLALDRRGNWRIKTAAGRFERIGNAAVNEFIGRNYAADPEGRWFFQNGPQRVYVSLDYTPWVYRLDDAGNALVAHTGAAPRAFETAFLDDAGALLVETDLGVGVLLDRDLPAVLDRAARARGCDAELMIEAVLQGREARIALPGATVAVELIRREDLAGRFGFVPRPAPRAGEPEC
jgi:hypothetical protein